jgi:hypothetical protein
MNMQEHVFEKAGLGKAPFFFDGWFEGNASYDPLHPNVPVTYCQYCSTLIRNCFRIKSSDGKTFIVGSECVKKTGDKGLIKIINEEVKKQKYTRETIRIELAKDHLEEVSEKLAEFKHPFFSDKTLFDYVEYLLRNGGHSGKLKGARYIEKALNNEL